MDFYDIKTRSLKNNVTEVYADFKVCRSKDLMVRGKSFYAIWDEAAGMWATDEYEVPRLVDAELYMYRDELAKKVDGVIKVRSLQNFSTNAWLEFRNYMSHISDTAVQLDSKLAFADTPLKKKDYASKRLAYSLQDGSIEAYDEIIRTLYEPDERQKIEWAIGSIVAGDSISIQKFLVLYGAAGTGKSTILNIVLQLFKGYYTVFDSKALTSNSNAFSTEAFKENPLVAIQQDGDLSRIEDNTKLNSIVSHEEMLVNEKFKASYSMRVNCFLFMGSNKPVRITDARSGIIRRLLDVRPTGDHIPAKKYQALMAQISFELGAIAKHCLDVYSGLGKDYYSNYRPLDMMQRTDPFLDYVESNYDLFMDQDFTTLNQAYALYKEYCADSNLQYMMPKNVFREELKEYFKQFSDRTWIGDQHLRSVYREFDTTKFVQRPEDEKVVPLVLDCDISPLDSLLSDCPAQYATKQGTPSGRWVDCPTKLSDLDTKKLHFVKPPENLVVIDFDLRDEEGKKAPELNLEAASKWPPTYSEYSKSGGGIHLHYFYDGDVSKLSSQYEAGIEVKTFRGGASLRRKLSFCNRADVVHISTGLPVKEEKVIDFDSVKSEKGLRNLIIRNLHKEIHPGTKPSIDFIDKILNESYSAGLHYDVTDLRPKIMAFAVNSTNQSEYCIKVVSKMKFKSEDASKPLENDGRLVFFDCEVFPNLFVVCWKYENSPNCVKMINPSPTDIEMLLRTMKLVGFNCRKYDNHILYARYMGYNNAQLFDLSQKLVSNSRNGTFAEAYSASYADVYDYTSKKQSLKKYEIELGIHHQELGLPWDEPVPEEKWELVAEYCCNDVEATEATHKARHADFLARQILASISGLTVNDTTQKHTAKILFGDDKHPQEKFLYTDLATGDVYSWPDKPRWQK